MKIAIIGGGISGLVCAYELSKNLKNQIDIYEAGNQIGGLLSIAKIQNKHPIEATYHHSFTTDTHLIELCKELNIEKKLQRFPSSTAIYYNKKIYNFMTPIDLLLYKPLTFLERIRLGLVTLYLQKKETRKSFATKKAAERCKKYFGKSIYKKFWTYLLQGKFNEYENMISMARLWHRIYIRSKSKRKGSNKEVLGYFENGYNTMVEAILKQIEGKVNIHTNTSVKKIETKTKEITTHKATKKFDAIIITIPSNTAQNILKGDTKKIDTINYIGEVNSIITSKQSLSNKYRINIYDTLSPFLVFIQHTNLVPNERYGGNHVYYIGKYIKNGHKYFNDKKKFEQESLTYLKKLFPQFDSNQIVEIQTFTFKNAQHIVTIDYQKKIPAKNIAESIYLLNFSQIYPEDRGVNYAIREAQELIKTYF